MWRELKICFFTSTDFKARNFLIYKYILCLTEVLEHKSFINICWMSELINESLRTIWRKHYNSIKSWAELKGEDQGKLEDHLEGSPREDTNQTYVLASGRPSSLVMFHTGQDWRQAMETKESQPKWAPWPRSTGGQNFVEQSQRGKGN